MIKKTAAMLLVILMLLPALSAVVMADETPLSLTIQCNGHKEPVPGIEYRLFRVADMADDGSYSLAPKFRDYPVELNSEIDARSLAVTLEGYIAADKIPADDRAFTDNSGSLTFPANGKKLSRGLYLVTCDDFEHDGHSYEAEPILVNLPSIDLEGKEVRAVKLAPKHNSYPDGTDSLELHVIKVWKDEGHEKKRPAEIEVRLHGDGELYDTVILNAQNNWRWHWTGLDHNVKWTVTEKPVEGYSVSVSREGVTYVITNTYNGEEPPGDGDEDPDDDDKDGDKDKEKLPQTGQLWWPVAPLAGAGLILTAAGLISRKRN